MIAWLKQLLGFERVIDHDDCEDDALRAFTLHEVVRTGVRVVVMRRRDGVFVRYADDPWIRLGPVPQMGLDVATQLDALGGGLEIRLAFARRHVVLDVLPPDPPAANAGVAQEASK